MRVACCYFLRSNPHASLPQRRACSPLVAARPRTSQPLVLLVSPKLSCLPCTHTLVRSHFAWSRANIACAALRRASATSRTALCPRTCGCVPMRCVCRPALVSACPFATAPAIRLMQARSVYDKVAPAACARVLCASRCVLARTKPFSRASCLRGPPGFPRARLGRAAAALALQTPASRGAGQAAVAQDGRQDRPVEPTWNAVGRVWRRRLG